jgi:hypothetical protein
VNYPDLVSDIPAVEQGHMEAPMKPGLGTVLLPDVRKRPGASIRVTKG